MARSSPRNPSERCSCCLEKSKRGEIEFEDIKKICAPIVSAGDRKSCGAQYLCPYCLLDQAEGLLQYESNGEGDDDEEGRLVIVNPINSTETIDWFESGLADFDPDVNNVPNSLPAFLFVNYGSMLSRKHPFLSLTAEGVKEKNEGYCRVAISLFDKLRTEKQKRQSGTARCGVSAAHPSSCPDCGKPNHGCYVSPRQLIKAGLPADALQVYCTTCTKEHAEEVVDEHGDISNVSTCQVARLFSLLHYAHIMCSFLILYLSRLI